MTKDPKKPIDCPSAQASAPGARIYGAQTGAPDARRVGYLTETLPVSEKLLGLAGPNKPTEIFRIAAPCMASGCKHFNNGACSLAQRIVEGLLPVVNALPTCQIRATCRWFHQEGKDACLRCPQIVTDVPNASDHNKLIAGVA